MWQCDVVARHHGEAANASAASSSSSAKTAIASIAPRCRHPWQLLPPKDACGEESLIDNVVIEKATSDEVDNSPDPGDGNTVNDIVVASDCQSVQLCAERDGTKDGRVYLVTLRASDSSEQCHPRRLQGLSAGGQESSREQRRGLHGHRLLRAIGPLSAHYVASSANGQTMVNDGTTLGNYDDGLLTLVCTP